MIDHRNRKKKLIISYKNLPEDIRELFKETYPEGYKEYLQKTIKPNGEPIFVVPLETDDTSYMVKFDVVIDTGLVEEDLDKDLYGDDSESESDFAPLSEAIEKEEGTSHAVGKMRHGALEEILDVNSEDTKKEFEIASADIAAEFGDQSDDEPDAYLDNDEPEEDDDDIEPDDDELLDIESLLEEADSGEGLLREENPPEEHRGRRKKNESAEIKAVKAVREEVKEARKTPKKESKAKETKAVKTKAEAPTPKSSKTVEKQTKTATKTTAKAATKTTAEKKTTKKK